jgi:hypothetical protein
LYSYSVFSAVFAIFVWRNQKAPFFCIFKKTKGLLRTTERMKLQIDTVSRVMSLLDSLLTTEQFVVWPMRTAHMMRAEALAMLAAVL